MYRIEGFHIYGGDQENTQGYYIREILDSGSDEYRTSVLSSEEKYSIISDLGLDRLTEVLRQAFRSNNHSYDANSEARFTYETLKKEVSDGH